MKKNLLGLGLFGLSLAACTADREVPGGNLEPQVPTGLALDDEAQLRAMGAEAGIAYIRLSKATVQQESALKGAKDEVLSSISSELSSGLRSAEVTELEPLFPIDKRYEKRMREAGLDQWYIVRFSSQLSLSKTLASLRGIPQVEYAEPSFKTSLPKTISSSWAFAPLQDASTPAPVPYPFNDPELNKQWHYQNFGTAPRAIRGADINLFEAWQTETGKPNVIVAIQDGGIDVTHPDLKDNLWVNTAELNGVAGVDDDGNGIVDDIHGFNTVTGKGDVYPDGVSHGTHVAGTVAARNNNGIGVSGVAGGDGSATSGVRMMSVQVFGKEQADGSLEPGDQERGFVYAANNGAVISQNSWGYNYPGPKALPKALKDAIDYFIKYAGCDADGNQKPDSPMKGGVVIFAAGNDGKDYVALPAAYPEVIAVGATATNWRVSSFSNRGDWVDIMAPGGEAAWGSAAEVYSTLAPSVSKGKSYGFMQGTSMACPHVSGVAALAVSHFGKQGFTNTELKQRILAALRPANVDKRNPEYQGRLGRGYIDATRVFATDQQKAPQAVSEIKVNTLSFLWADISWLAVADEDDGTATEYFVYLSETELTESNLEGKLYQRFLGQEVEVGDRFDLTLKSLKDDTDYYVGVVAVDRWGNKSPLKAVKLHTLKNTPPALTLSTTEPLRVMSLRKETFSLTASDADGHQISLRVAGDSRGVSYNIQGNVIHFTLSATAPVGKYTIQVIARDELGAETELAIPFEVYKYIPPTFKETITAFTQGVGKTKLINIVRLVDNPGKLPLRYSITSPSDEVVQASISEAGVVTLNGAKRGASRLQVLVEDEFGAKISTSIQLHVVADERQVVHALYPTPAKRNINVLLNTELGGDTQIEIISALGNKVFSGRYRPDKTGLLTLPVHRLSPGSYRLEATTQGGVKTVVAFSKI